MKRQATNEVALPADLKCKPLPFSSTASVWPRTGLANLTILFSPGHERVAERAIDRIRYASFDAVLVGLPEDLETTVRDHVKGTVPEETVWKEYRIVTGLHERLVEPVRRRIHPLLQHLARRALLELKTRVFCYEDLSSHGGSGRAAEKLLLLQTAERIRRQVIVEEWRDALVEELESSKESWERSMENLVEKANGQDHNMVMYSGLICPLRERLVEQGFSVGIISLGTYWRSPIEVLRALMWVRRSGQVSDEEIEQCVREQMRYLDFVISSESPDVAHEKWTTRRARVLLRRQSLL